MTVIQPPMRHRIVGAALRRYRQKLGLSLDDAADILECDRSKISRIETGQRGIRNRELRDLLTEYGVGIRVQETLAVIARLRGANGWWRAYANDLPDAYLDMIALETAAPQIMIYEMQLVPDLLQVKEYTHAFAAECADLTPDALRQKLATACLKRQEAVHSKPRPKITVVIGEAALKHMPGMPAVKHAQLDALTSAISSSPGICLQVLPSQNGAHIARAAGSFTILRYAQEANLEVVYQRGISSGTFVDDQREIERYILTFRKLTESALTPDASSDLIKQAHQW